MERQVGILRELTVDEFAGKIEVYRNFVVVQDGHVRSTNRNGHVVQRFDLLHDMRMVALRRWVPVRLLVGGGAPPSNRPSRILHGALAHDNNFGTTRNQSQQ